MSAISHLLPLTLHVWRSTLVSDGSGGFTEGWADQGTIAANVNASSAAERTLAQQAGAAHTHNIYLEPDADVKRNDRLAFNGVDIDGPSSGDQWYDIHWTDPKYEVTGSGIRYLKCQAERVESG